MGHIGRRRRAAAGVRGQGVQDAGGGVGGAVHRGRVRPPQGVARRRQLDAEHGGGHGRLRGPRRRARGRHAHAAGPAAGRRPHTLLRPANARAKGATRQRTTSRGEKNQYQLIVKIIVFKI